MTAKRRRLITDSFKVMKKSRKEDKIEKSSPSPPPQPEADANTMSNREKELEKLRQFDLDWRYGPCTGISRMERWDRAQLHGLNPPEEIRTLLLCTRVDAEYTQSLWNNYAL